MRTTRERTMHPGLRRRSPLAAPLRSEEGFTLISALLVAALVTALGAATMFLGHLDLTLAGNYRVQRTAEVAADGALEMAKAMIFGNVAALNLPLSIPGTASAAQSWRAGADTSGDLVGDGFSYSDQDADVSITIRYKLEDNIHYNVAEAYADEVVRYGKDYQYHDAQKNVGRQPVYVVTFTDNATGTKGEADLISTIGFNTPAALFCGGRVHMQKYDWATEESIEVTSGVGTPAVATASTSANITIETVQETTTFAGTTKLTLATAAGSGTITVGSTTNFPAAGQILVGDSLVSHTGVDATHFTGCTGVPAAAAGTFVNVSSGSRNYNAINPTSNNDYALSPAYLHRRVYRPSEVTASKTAGLYNQARESAHILLGVGDRLANLDAAFLSGGATAANALFSFYNAGVDAPVAFDNSVTPHLCSGVVCYDFQMPTAQAPLTQLETMFGQSFADLKSLADQEFTCSGTSTLPNPLGTSNRTCNLSGVSLGTDAAPQVAYFNGAGTEAIRLYTTPGTQVAGSGILIIDGDAEIIGSINWRGLMLIRGDLVFKPWQGGTQTARSGPELSTNWKGFIIIGGDLDLWTFWGGSILLGYSTNDVASIKGIISATVPHRVLSWRRTYD